jgi:hypothetical protein
VIDIEPLGMSTDDMAAILAQVACSAPGSTGVLWHYSTERRTVLVGVVRDRRLVQWLMQPAPTESEAARVATRWTNMLSNADAVQAVLTAVGAAVDAEHAQH